MPRHRLQRPSSALVVSTVALFVALGGTSYAAFTLPSNSVGTKQLKAGAVTGPKIGNGAVTGPKLNLAGFTVPNAQHADNADSAGKADEATSATNASHANTADNATNAANANNAANATNAVNANHANTANFATNATNASNASHAATADTATNAINATSASDSAALGGISAAGYTRNGCDVTTGQIKGFAYVDPSSLTSSFTTLSVAYNCSLSPVEAKRISAGQYEVWFENNPALIAVGSTNDGGCSGNPCPGNVSFENVGGGEWKVLTTNSVDTPLDYVFNLIVP